MTTQTETQAHCWSTQSEIDFVYRIARSKNALTKLRGYIDAMSKRADFGSIDANAVMSVAREKLEYLRGVAL